MPFMMLGVGRIRDNWAFMKDMGRTVSGPKCPECERGVLVCASDPSEIHTLGEGHEEILYTWQCASCDFALLARNSADARDQVARNLTVHAQERIQQLPSAEYQAIVTGHRRTSRLFFLLAAVTVIGALYMLASGAPIRVALTWLSIALVLFLLGMKKSFRSWQAHTGRIFEPGAFRYWLLNEKWIV
jgi:hypothetical protein